MLTEFGIVMLIVGIVVGSILVKLPAAARYVAARLDERLQYQRLCEGERRARVAVEHDLVGARVQRDEALAAAFAWEQRANRLKAEAAAAAATAGAAGVTVSRGRGKKKGEKRGRRRA